MMKVNYGIRTHVAWLTFLPLLVMAFSMETFFLYDRFTDMDRELLTRGQLIARELAVSSEYGVFSGNSQVLSRIAENALQQPDVIGVAVLNSTANIIVSKGVVPSVITNMESAAGRADSLLGRVNAETSVFNNGKTILLYQAIVSIPLALDELDAKPDVQQNGAVIVEMNEAQTNKLKAKLLWFTLLLTCLFLLVTQYLVRIASRRITDPISQLSAAVRAIGEGHLETRVTLPTRIDELCNLMNGINQMTVDLQHERNNLQYRIDEATQQLRTLAFYDTLTLLPNRRLLNDRLTQALATSNHSGHYGALMFLDLDNFKPLNDKFGHAAGDMLLIEAAHRISRCLTEMDTAARFGGDEFVVMLSELDADYEKSVMQAKIVAEKIRAALAQPYLLKYQSEDQQVKKVEHRCTSSIGVAMFFGHEASEDEVMILADTVMYQAKLEGRNRICFFQPEHTPLS